MRGQFSEIFFLILIILIIGPTTISYFAEPRGSLIEFIVINSFKAWITMPLPMNMNEFSSVINSIPAAEHFAPPAIKTLVLGIVNLLKIVIFIYLTGYMLMHIWAWLSVVANVSHRISHRRR